jgi:acyl-CoA reductase-like NAD-dependent aldehyde dehydrogenase
MLMHLIHTGPVLPVVRVNSIDDAVQHMNAVCSHPLAL